MQASEREMEKVVEDMAGRKDELERKRRGEGVDRRMEGVTGENGEVIVEVGCNRGIDERELPANLGHERNTCRAGSQRSEVRSRQESGCGSN